MTMNNTAARPNAVSGKQMSALCCMALLALGLSGCASNDPVKTQVMLSDFGSCEQDLLKIQNSLCSGDLEAKPGLDPHDVIGLAKPGLDPHRVCYSSFSLSAVNSATCSCEIQRFKWMAKIEYCHSLAAGDEGKYKACLDGLKSTVCPSM
jgi:hypothetical protein